MENVNTLRFKTHKYYVTENDCDEIERLGINLKDDTIVLSKHEIYGIDTLPLVQDREKLNASILPENCTHRFIFFIKQRN